jgi:hypothetical protein
MNKNFELDLEQMIPPESFDEAAKAARENLEGAGGSGDKRWAKALSALGGSKIAAAISAQLKQHDLLKDFAEGWAKSPAFAVFADKKKHPDGKSETVKLGSFKQELTYEPELTLSAAGLTSGPISFTIALKAEFDAVEVTVLNAHLTEMGGGTIKVAVDFKCGAVKLFTKSTPVEYKLVERKKFPDPGISLNLAG